MILHRTPTGWQYAETLTPEEEETANVAFFQELNTPQIEHEVSELHPKLWKSERFRNFLSAHIVQHWERYPVTYPGPGWFKNLPLACAQALAGQQLQMI